MLFENISPSRVARFFLILMGTIYHDPKTVPNAHIIYQISKKHTKCPPDVPNCFITRPSKIYKNWDFGETYHLSPILWQENRK
jgi:hypothetical protein